MLFVDQAFRLWDLRKIYFESFEFVFDDYSSGIDKYFDVEARLTEHHFYDGRYWDLVISSISRSRWHDLSARIAFIRSQDGPVESQNLTRLGAEVDG